MERVIERVIESRTDSRSESGNSARDLDARLATGSELLARPVVWAIDAFSKDVAALARTAEAIRALAPYSPIHPVYVLNEDSFNGQGFTSFLKPALKSMAFKNLQLILNREEFESLRRSKSLQTPRILLERKSLEAGVEKLMRYARRLGSPMIAVGTHGRSVFARYLTGSFAETLMDANSVPILMTGPDLSPVVGQPKVVVFPTDFSESCRRAFDNVLGLAVSTGAELHIFHKNNHPLDAFVQTGVNLLGGGWVSVETYLQELPFEHEAQAREWLTLAELAGVPAKFVREDDPEATCDSIVEYAKSLKDRSPIIAMVVQVGQMSGWILGSVTRDVIRKSPYPVYLPPRIALDSGS